MGPITHTFRTGLNVFISPLLLSIVGICVAGVLVLTGFALVAVILLSVSLGWLWLWSTPLFTNWLLRRFEQEYGPVLAEELEPVDAIVILGGGVRPALPPRLYPELNVAGNRVLHAARLYKAGKAKWILSTGWPGYRPYDTPEPVPDGTCVILGELGISKDVVLVEDRSLNTHQNAQFSKAIIREHAIESLILVTSAIHMPRAVAEFQYVCKKITPAPIDFVTPAIPGRFFLDILPTAGALNSGSELMHELVGRIALFIRR